jgi:hypothetical protein
MTHSLQIHYKFTSYYDRERVPKLPPFSANALQHAAFRVRLAELGQLSKKVQKFNRLKHAWRLVSKLHKLHSHQEDAIIFPVLETKNAGVTKTPIKQHRDLEALEVCLLATP